MRKILFLSISSLLFTTVLFVSCTKDSIESKINETINSKLTGEEMKINSLSACSSNPDAFNTIEDRDSAIEYFNNLFSSENYPILEKTILSNLVIFNNLDSLMNISNFNSTTFDVNLVNDYLRLNGKQEIDAQQYFNEGKSIIQDTSTDVNDFIGFLKKYNVYSNEMLNLFANFDNEIMSSHNNDYTNALLNLNINIEQSNLSSFEKNTMKLYSLIIKGFLNLDYFKQGTISGRDECSDCIKKNKWKIFGWGALWLIASIIACIVLAAPGGPIAIIACIIAVAGAGILYAIQTACGRVCSWI